tara:strand:+ start:44 stop:607 length:564 start_codon:yes stop_codon:yes gene_type:complete
MAIDPFTAMMIMKGVSTVINHQGQQAAAAARNAAIYKQKLAIRDRLKAQYSSARQGFADSDIARINIGDAKAESGIEARLNEMRVASSLKASGIPQGQSTKALSRGLIGGMLNKESKFLKQLQMKNAELDMRDRNLQQQMDIAWLDAKAQIAGSSYGKGPGFVPLALNLGADYLDAKAYGKKMGSEV